MARPKTRKERDEEHRGKNKKKKDKKKTEPRVTYITQRDGTIIPVVNYLDNAGQRLNREDMAEMLEIYSIFGSRGKEMWKASRQEIKRGTRQRRNQLSNDDVVGRAAQRENMDSYRRAMSGVAEYATRQRGQHQRFMNREREMLQNYMLRIRAQAPVLAERMQRNINLAAMQGGPGVGGGGGGGGGGGSRGSSGSGSSSGSGEQPQGRDGDRKKPQGDYELKYADTPVDITASAMGIPEAHLARIQNPETLEGMFFAKLTDAVANQGLEPRMAAATFIEYYSGHPAVDLEVLSTAAQLGVNHWRLAAGESTVDELPEFMPTDNPMLAIGLDPAAAQDIAQEESRNNPLSGSPDAMFRDENFELSGLDTGLQNRATGAQQEKDSGPGRFDALAAGVGSTIDAAQESIEGRDFSEDPIRQGLGVAKDTIAGSGGLWRGIGNAASGLGDVARGAGDVAGYMAVPGFGLGLWDAVGGGISEGAQGLDRLIGSPFTDNLDSDGLQQLVESIQKYGEPVPSGRLPAPPSGPETPESFRSGSDVRPGDPTFQGSDRYAGAGTGQDLWGSLIPGIASLIGQGPGNEMDEEQSQQFMAEVARGNASGALEAVRNSIQSDRSRESEKQSDAEERRKKFEEFMEEVRAQQRTAAAQESIGTPSATPGAGWVAPTQPFAIPGAPQPTTLQSNGDGSFSDPGFVLGPLKPKPKPDNDSIDRLIRLFV